MKVLKVINPQQATKKEVDQYRVRQAARAVVIDPEGQIGLLKVVKRKFYKLPGGGIEAGESQQTALKRECQEEIGCNVEILDEIGTIVEYRKMFQIKQISHCYLAKLVGAKGKPKLTQEEKDEGYQPLWVPYQQAVDLMNNSQAQNLESKFYIVPRDKIFINHAKINSCQFIS